MMKRCWRHWSDSEKENQPLFLKRREDPMDKIEVVALVECEVRLRGHGLRDEQRAGGCLEGTSSGSWWQG